MAIQIYTDGGSRRLHKPNMVGGYGAVIKYGDHSKDIYGAVPESTNQQMEIKAVVEALRSLVRYDIPVEIYSDSAYVINACNDDWIGGWVKNGWKNSKKQPVANKELWLDLIEQNNLFSNITYHKVRGHSGDEWNEYADMLAGKAMDEWEEEIGI